MLSSCLSMKDFKWIGNITQKVYPRGLTLIDLAPSMDLDYLPIVYTLLSVSGIEQQSDYVSRERRLEAESDPAAAPNFAARQELDRQAIIQNAYGS